MRSPGGGARVWTAPALLAFSTAAGLFAGLLGDGAWDVVGSCAVGLPLAVALRFLWRGGEARPATVPSRIPARRL